MNRNATQSSVDAILGTADISGGVLVLGCGNHSLIADLAKARPGVRISAVDEDDAVIQRIRVALSREPAEIQERVKCVQSGYYRLPFADNSLSFVMISLGFGKVKSWELLFQEIYRIARSQAEVAIIIPKNELDISVSELHSYLSLFGEKADVREDANETLIASVKLWKKPRIIGMMRIKNEERWIQQTLDSAEQLVDGFVILDDGSTDRTPEICRSHPRVLRFEQQQEPTIDEVRDKNKLLKWVLEQDPDWVISLDGDDVLEDAAQIAVRREIAICANNTSGLAIKYPFMWDRHDQTRGDSRHRNEPQPRIFKVNGIGVSPSSLAFSPSNHGGNFHGGSIPNNLPGQITYTDISIKHYGYFEKQRRVAKYEFYQKNDPEYASKGLYDHLISEDAIIFPWRERKLSEVVFSDAKPSKAADEMEQAGNRMWPVGLFFPPQLSSWLDISSDNCSIDGLNLECAKCVVAAKNETSESSKSQYGEVIECDPASAVEQMISSGRMFELTTIVNFDSHFHGELGKGLLDKLEQITLREIVLVIPNSSASNSPDGPCSPDYLKNHGYRVYYIPNLLGRGKDAYAAAKIFTTFDQEVFKRQVSDNIAFLAKFNRFSFTLSQTRLLTRLYVAVRAWKERCR